MHLDLLQQLARLSSQALLIHGPAAPLHAARFSGVLKRALAGDLARDAAATFADTADADKPWNAREQVYIGDGVAVVPVCGQLAGGLDACTAWWLDCCRYEAIQEAAGMLAARADVRTVVFDVNSPGGYITGVRETLQIIARDLAGKLTIAWSAQQDCSAAYWLSCACQRMIFAPSATVANIGAMCVAYDYSKLFEEAGVSVKVFKSGKYKGEGVMGAAPEKEVEEFLQEWVDGFGAQFRADVQAARPDANPSDMQGQWFTGEQAVARKFADATALNLDELLDTLAAAPRI